MESPRQISLITDVELTLPLEIEYEILVTAFHANIYDRCRLLLVSKSVFAWLIPLLYRVIALEWKSWLNKDPHLSSLQKHGHHTRHLFLMTPGSPFPDWGHDLLRYCPNVSNLGFWYGTSLTSDVFDLPIKRLILHNFAFLKNQLDKESQDARLSCWCSNITHLGLGEKVDESMTRYLAHFPALKYFMILEFMDNGGSAGALKYCPQLKVVVQVLAHVSDNGKTAVVRQRDGESQDPRIVKIDGLVMADWVRGANGQPDMWKLAEREVDRRNGLVDNI